jgi:hypothetical protein
MKKHTVVKNLKKLIKKQKNSKIDKKSTKNLNNSPSLFLLDNETPLGDESVDETLRTYSGGVSGLKVISGNI